jgi:STE24 endopeptidase
MVTIIYITLLGLMLLSFISEQWLGNLEHKSYSSPIPPILSDVYDEETLKKQKSYHNDGYFFELKQDIFFFVLTFAVIATEFLGIIDSFIRQYIHNEAMVMIVFFAIFGFAYLLLGLPFSYYDTFVIEQKYGFNTSTKKIFFTDLIKSLLLGAIIGVPLLWLVFIFYQNTGAYFWLYSWGLLMAFSLFFTFFYSKLIVPLFNKQTPLQDGELKQAIIEFCRKADFPLKEVYVMDASKRSKKANAYFTGFGKNKRIVLFDTLIEQLSTPEIVAVLAHEIGHFKHKHIIASFIYGMLQTGITLFILSLFLTIPEFSLALGAVKPSFHIGLVAFSILYSPISFVVSVLFNYLSRMNEKQADLYAKSFGQSEALVSGLKKLAAKNFSHLTPHPLTVKLSYSHPPLRDRIELLIKI